MRVRERERNYARTARLSRETSALRQNLAPLKPGRVEFRPVGDEVGEKNGPLCLGPSRWGDPVAL